MKKVLLYLFFSAFQSVLFAQEFFPDGTKWTEIRLDTLKYDSWYSSVGDEFVPNYETIEYYVKGEYESKWPNYQLKYTCVYTTGPEWADSLFLMINERITEDDIYIGAMTPNLVEEFALPAEVYQMKWSIGKELYYRDVVESNMTNYPVSHKYGMIEEIKEGAFGGDKTLQYVDLNGVRIIYGIGVTEWKDGECLFGPITPYVYTFYNKENPSAVRHYRSMLVHFERNGEVLYDLWPEKTIVTGIRTVSNDAPSVCNSLYNLQGNKIQQEPKKGIYIQNGKKYVK